MSTRLHHEALRRKQWATALRATAREYEQRKPYALPSVNEFLLMAQMMRRTDWFSFELNWHEKALFLYLVAEAVDYGDIDLSMVP